MKENSQKCHDKAEKKKVTLPNLSKYPRLSMFLNLLLGAILLSTCIVVSYLYWTQQIGDGAYKYSDEIYKHIEDTVAASAIPDVGLDRLPLQKELTKFVDTYENGETELFCRIQDGYFRAEVTVTMSENCTITGSSRNFNTLQGYMKHYWLDLGVRVLVSALAAFLLAEGFFFGIMSLRAYVSKKSKDKKEKVEDNAVNNTTPTLVEEIT